MLLFPFCLRTDYSMAPPRQVLKRQRFSRTVTFACSSAPSFSCSSLWKRSLLSTGELQGVLDLALVNMATLPARAQFQWTARAEMDYCATYRRLTRCEWLAKAPRYKEFMEKGLLSQKLKHWQLQIRAYH